MLAFGSREIKTNILAALFESCLAREIKQNFNEYFCSISRPQADLVFQALDSCCKDNILRGALSSDLWYFCQETTEIGKKYWYFTIFLRQKLDIGCFQAVTLQP